jgi:hypothetical protein
MLRTFACLMLLSSVLSGRSFADRFQRRGFASGLGSQMFGRRAPQQNEAPQPLQAAIPQGPQGISFTQGPQGFQGMQGFQVG